MNQTGQLTRTALLVALTLVLQGIRLVLPVPPQVSLFFIGSLVNACLVVAALRLKGNGWIAIAIITPIFAWLEGMLPFPLFIPLVAIGNLVYIIILRLFKSSSRSLGNILAVIVKTIVLFGGFTLLFMCINVPPKVSKMILFAMSWPQLITGTVGIVIGRLVSSYISET